MSNPRKTTGKPYLLVLLPCLFLAPLQALASEKFELLDGDRVVLLGGTLIEREPEYGYWETLLTIRYPERNITYRNLGWSGDTVFCDARAQFDPPAVGFRNLQEQLKTLKPTVILVGYGSNESFDGEAGLPRFRQGLAILLNKLDQTKARIVLLSPPHHEDLGRPLPHPADRNRGLRLYGDALRQETEKRHFPFIDLFDLLEGGPKKNPLSSLTDNGIHFNSYGYWRAGFVIERVLGPSCPPWFLDIKFDGKTKEIKGAKLSEIQVSPLRFQITDSMLPAPPPPVAWASQNPSSGKERVLKIGMLPPGRYGLHVDGKPVAGGTAAEWGAGVRLSRGPEFHQVEKLRAIIVEKNRLYFHRWRPQNETYLYGFRKKEQGKNAKEIPEFDALIGKMEAEIANLRKPVPHRYELRLESREKE
jgi:lysophospholipase L1-like esterase